MKRILTIVAVVVALMVIIGLLYDRGVFDGVSWQPLTMILAALAGPFMLVKNWFQRILDTENRRPRGARGRVQESEQRYDNVRAQETQVREQLDQEIRQREQRVQQLKEEEKLIDDRIRTLREQRESVHQEVENMDDEQLNDEFGKYYG